MKNLFLIEAECSNGCWVKTKEQNYLHPVVTPRARTHTQLRHMSGMQQRCAAKGLAIHDKVG